LPRSIAVAVTEASQVGEARRAVAALTRLLGFDEEASGRAALIVTEAATNLVKHAREGVLVLRPLEDGAGNGVEVLALDRGPGMADPGKCLRDGYSTAGTPGQGLGAIVRLSGFVDIYSHRPTGSALLARLGPGSTPAPGHRLQVEAISLPRAGEEVCGDCWAVAHEGGRTLVLVADGLGHGPLAAEASGTAARVFRDNARLGPVEILQALHRALHATRGAAVAVAEVDVGGESIRYAGVGNIAGLVLAGGTSRSMVSHNGTVGHQALRFQEFTYPFPKGALLVMHSDGLASRWGLEAYPGLAVRDPALVAGVLYRDFQRGRDDVTVLAARAGEGAGA
jgi:anti-sigma regulatory factor (Ser/Thr protein kinase)